MHGEPSRTSPTPRENRGHRGLTAPVLPVSRMIAARHVCTITHTRVGRCIQARSPAYRLTFSFHSTLYVLIRTWNVPRRDWGVQTVAPPLCEYSMKYVLTLQCGNMHRREYFSHLGIYSGPHSRGVRRYSARLCKHDAHAAWAADS